MQTVLQKMSAPLIKVHATFLIHQGLQQLVFRLADLI